MPKIIEISGESKSRVNARADTDVTLAQAADFLNVTRPALTQLVQTGALGCLLVNGRRRLLMADLIRFKEQQEAERQRGLDELVAEAQRLGMY